MSEYDLDDVRTAAAGQKIEYRGRRVQIDIQNLNYELPDVIQCLMQLTAADFRRTIPRDGEPSDDEYICSFKKPGNDDREPDELYVKFCLVDGYLTIDLGSFHLTRY